MRSYSFDFNISSKNNSQNKQIRLLRLNDIKCIIFILIYFSLTQLFFRLDLGIISIFINLLVFIFSIYILYLIENDITGHSNNFIIVLFIVCFFEILIGALFFTDGIYSNDHFKVFFSLITFLFLILRTFLLFLIRQYFKILSTENS